MHICDNVIEKHRKEIATWKQSELRKIFLVERVSSQTKQISLNFMNKTKQIYNLNISSQ